MDANANEFTHAFFEESSRAWMENKVRVGAMIQYRCTYKHSNGTQCVKPCEAWKDLCRRHRVYGKTEKPPQETPTHSYNLRRR